MRRFSEGEHERVKTAVDEGTLIHLANLSLGPHERVYKENEGQGRTVQWRNRAREEAVAGFQSQYGESEVTVSVPFDPETGNTTSMPGRLGVYVTSTAYEAAQQQEPRPEL